jgi:REP element-mobilizing transposase RayT
MPYDPDRHHRRSTRLKGYDYAQEGAYFITICTYAKQWLFGEIENDKMMLNHYGEIVANCWLAIPTHFPHIELDEFVIMPNHMHGIVVITDSLMTVGAQHAAPASIPQIKAGSLPAVIRSFKSAVTYQVNKQYHASGERFWQKNYHDHIIRSETSLNHLRGYTINNPALWIKDKYWEERL